MRDILRNVTAKERMKVGCENEWNDRGGRSGQNERNECLLSTRTERQRDTNEGANPEYFRKTEGSRHALFVLTGVTP